MSEISKSRRGRVRRNVTALVSAVALACGTVAVAADADVRNELYGPAPRLSAEIRSDKQYVSPGDEVTFSIAPRVSPIFPAGTSGSPYGQSELMNYRVWFWTDGASVPELPSAEDFIWSDGQTRPFIAPPQAVENGWMVDFGTVLGGAVVRNGSVRARVKDDVEPGQQLTAWTEVAGSILPYVGWTTKPGRIPFERTGTDMYGQPTCAGTATSEHVLQGNGYGHFLFDMWVGTTAANATLEPVNIKLTYPDGSDHTRELVEKVSLGNLNQGFLGNNRPAFAPNLSQVYNWPNRPTEDTWAPTGEEVWIPSGATLSVSQRVNAVGDSCNTDTAVQQQVFIESGRDPWQVGTESSVNFRVLPAETPTASVTVTTTPTTVTTTATETPTTVTTTATVTPSTATTIPTVTPSTATTIPTVTPSTATTIPTVTPSTESVTETTTVATATTTAATETATATVTPTTVTTTPTVTAGTVTTTATTTVTADCDCEPVTATVTNTIPAEPSTVTETPEPATVTKTEPAPKRGEIGDRVWVDENGDGKEDPGEKTGVSGVTVEIVDKAGNEVTRTVTDKDGNWKVDVEPGEYTVRYVPGNNTPSEPRQVERTITIKPGEKNSSVDLGILPKSSIGDRVWNDEDGDGKQGPNEKGLENVVVLVSREGEPTRSAVTDKNGDWKIEGLNPNKEYEVRFIKPEGWEVTGKVPGSDESGLISKVTLEPKQYNDTYDLGLRKIDGTCDCELEKPGTIGDRVWIDVNGDGKEDSDEKTGVPGVTVVISDKDGNEVTRTVTDNDGNWKVDVVPGDYTVTYEPGDHTPSQPNQITSKITVEPGKKYLDIDLGILPRGTVGDRVWNDEDGDGVQDDNEKGLRDVVVQVSRNGEPTRTTTTDENGNWFIEGLKPNTEYQVRFIKPEGWDVTGKVPGSDESGLISKVTLKPGERNDAYDLGLRRTPTTPVAPPEQPGKFGGNIIVINPDGSKEGVENVIVRATPPSGVDEPVRTGTTNKDGAWTITNLTPNVEYEVTYILPKGYRVTYLPDGATLDKDGNVTVTVKVNDKVPTILDFGLEVERGGSEDPEPSTVVNTVTETVVAKPDASSDGTLEKCWANATQSPLLYLVPVALLGAVGGELARPYAALINEQINKVNAELAAAFNRNTPDWGNGGRGADRNDPFAELRAQFDAANREFQKIANDPNVQRLGTAAAVILGLVALGGVLYDWCSNEPGEAKTASSKRTGGKPTTTVPTSPTEPTEPTTAETPTQQP